MSFPSKTVSRICPFSGASTLNITSDVEVETSVRRVALPTGYSATARVSPVAEGEGLKYFVLRLPGLTRPERRSMVITTEKSSRSLVSLETGSVQKMRWFPS